MYLLIIIAILLLLISVTRGGVIRRMDAFITAISTSSRAMVWLFLISLGFSVLLTLFIRLPEPRVHDEFSYLLQADTFSKGRLANSPHPLWQFFETFHVLQQPAYVSKYPPAQGAALALGQLLWRPVLGVWLSTAMAVSVMFWMLRAVVPARWAFMGALLTLLNPEIMEWNWSFWGGGLPLLGGALLLGGFFRLMLRSFKARNAIVSGSGMAILCLSRPFEGLVISVLVGSALAFIYLRGRGIALLMRAFLIMGGAAGAGVLLLLFYNLRITGHPLTMPYMIHEKTYSMTPVFLWQEVQPPPQYNHGVMEKFYKRYRDYFLEQKRWSRYLDVLKRKTASYQNYTWNGFLAFCLLFAFYPLKRNIPVRYALVLLFLFVLITLGLSTYSMPHYAAPAIPLLILMTIISLRYLSAWYWRDLPIGYYLSRGFIVLLCSASIVWFAKDQRSESDGWEYQRAALLDQLAQKGGKHLVVVRYNANHVPDNEWVYNEANIEASKIVWARDLGEDKNQELLNYFKDREIWMLEPGKRENIRLQPLSPVFNHINPSRKE